MSLSYWPDVVQGYRFLRILGFGCQDFSDSLTKNFVRIFLTNFHKNFVGVFLTNLVIFDQMIKMNLGNRDVQMLNNWVPGDDTGSRGTGDVQKLNNWVPGECKLIKYYCKICNKITSWYLKKLVFKTVMF